VLSGMVYLTFVIFAHLCVYVLYCLLVLFYAFSDILSAVIYLMFVIIAHLFVCVFDDVLVSFFWRFWSTFSFGLFHVWSLLIYSYVCFMMSLSDFDALCVILSGMVYFIFVIFAHFFACELFDLLVLFQCVFWYAFRYVWFDVCHICWFIRVCALWCSCVFLPSVFWYIFSYDLFYVCYICLIIRVCALWMFLCFLCVLIYLQLLFILCLSYLVIDSSMCFIMCLYCFMRFWYTFTSGLVDVCHKCWFIRVCALWSSCVILCVFDILSLMFYFMFDIFAYLFVCVLYELLLCFYPFLTYFRVRFIICS